MRSPFSVRSWKFWLCIFLVALTNFLLNLAFHYSTVSHEFPAKYLLKTGVFAILFSFFIFYLLSSSRPFKKRKENMG